MPTTIATTDATTIPPATAVVYVSETLGRVWTRVPFLRLDRLERHCAPNVDEAHLHYDYGTLIPPDPDAGTDPDIDYTQYRPWPPLELDGMFCKVIVAPGIGTPFAWYGIIEADVRQVAGNSSGKQKLVAYGLLRLLEQETIRSAVVYQRASEAADSTVEPTLTLPRGLAFNVDESGQFVDRGNRSSFRYDPATGEQITQGGSFIFSDEPRGQNEWTALTAVEYLLAWHQPRDSAGDPIAAWSLSVPVTATDLTGPIDGPGGVAPAGALDWYKVSVPTDRRTVKEVIDALIDRRRLVGYYATYTEPAAGVSLHEPGGRGTVTLNCYSFASADIPLPGGATLSANPNLFTLNFESAFDITDAMVTNLVSSRYDRIIVEGARKTSTGTFLVGEDPEDSQLLEDWTDDELDKYVDGASLGAGYSALSQEDKVKANELVRLSDALKPVFARFTLTPAWPKHLADPDLGSDAPKYWFAPRVDANGLPLFLVGDDDAAQSSSAGEPLWLRGATFLHHLPILDRNDYSSTNIASLSYASYTGDGAPEFARPVFVIRTKEAVPADDDADPPVPEVPAEWQHVDKLAIAGTDWKWSVHCHVLDRAPSIELRVAGGAQQLLAKKSWAQHSPAATEPDDDPAVAASLDYSDVRCTLCMELDSRVSAEILLAPTAAGVPERTLTIHVHDARLDYIVPQTILDAKQGALVKTTSGGYVRDDRGWLKDIATAAAAWYSVPRQAIELAFRQVRPLVPLGGLIVDAGPTYSLQGVNSVVTRQSFDLLAQTTSFQTSFAELDLT